MKHYLFITSLLFLLSCAGDKNIDEEESTVAENQISLTQEQSELAGIKTSEIEYQNISHQIFCTGKLEATPDNRAKISVPVEGYVKKINVRKGQLIQQNTVLIFLQHPAYIDLQKNYLQAKEQLNLLSKEYERQKTLNENNAGTGKIFEQATSELEGLKIEVEALKQQLKLINISVDQISAENIISSIPVYSPINGIVNQLNITVSQYIKPDDILLEVISNDDFQITLDVFEREINKIRIGQNVIYKCNMPESINKAFTGEITHISNYIDEISKTFEVIVKPDSIYPGMRHGIFLSSRIQLSEQKLAALPEEAVLSEGDEHYVFIAVSDTSFIKQYIETGISKDGYISVISPDLTGKRIVVEGSHYINAELVSE